MDPQWLLTDDLWRRLLALGCMLLPALLILISRRSRWVSKLFWATGSQLPWAFLYLYLEIWRYRYEEASGVPPLGEAMGWWMLAFPWAVYLLYRGTRARFAGEKHD